MNEEAITKVAEAIKTLNLTFDGSLNSQTVEKVAQILSPYIFWYQIKSFMETVIIVSGLVLIARYIFMMFKTKMEQR